MKKVIAIDLDEVLLDQNPKLIDLYEKEFGIRLKEEDFRGRKIYDTPEAYHLRQHLFDQGFFKDAPIMPNSQEVVKWLQQYFDIFIITSTTEFKNSLNDKYDWLQEHFPFISFKHYIFCGQKSFMKGDYMIDDRANNLEFFDGEKLLFSAPHNYGEKRFTRVNNWQEVKTYFEKELNSI